MYIYKKTEPQLWTVGYHDPEGNWNTDSDFASPEQAAQRVHYLNGDRDPDQGKFVWVVVTDRYLPHVYSTLEQAESQGQKYVRDEMVKVGFIIRYQYRDLNYDHDGTEVVYFKGRPGTL